MLSIANVSAGAASSRYYENDNYYAKDSEEAREASQWFGKGAEELGLTGEVNGDRFQEILYGKIAEDVQLGTMRGGEREHRPGTDLTFSAPKSVSVLALVGGDKRLIAAHNEAVKSAMKVVEEQFVQTRIREGKDVRIEQVDKIVAGIFQHDTSRALDPQLHSHAVIANAVMSSDGQWRSMDNSQLFDNKMMLGALYRSELAANIKELGYSIEQTHSDGRFEVKGVSQELIDGFSNRRKDIVESLANFRDGTYDARLAAQAALVTREAKQNVHHQELHPVWSKRADGIQANFVEAAGRAAVEAEHGDSREQERNAYSNPTFLERLASFFAKARGRGESPFEGAGASGAITKDMSQGDIAKAAVEYAVEHLREKSAGFTPSNLVAEALNRSIGDVKYAAVNDEIDRRIENKSLILGSDGRHAHYTARASLNEETAVISYMRDGQGTREAIMPAAQAAALDLSHLTLGQQHSARMILSNQDFMTGVQGSAGVGKTTMLKTVREVMEARTPDVQLRGVAPAGSQANTLMKEAGIRSTTIHAFIAANEAALNGRMGAEAQEAKKQELAKSVFVMDEASLASTVLTKNFLNLLEAGGSKVVLLGDSKQLGAVEAGKPFSQLQAAGMQTSRMDEILRQRNAPELLKAVEYARDGNIIDAFKKIDSTVQEVARSEQGVHLSKSYLAQSKEQRDNTLVVVPTRALRDEVNGRIRDGLKLKDEISGPEYRGPKYVTKDMTRPERCDARRYQLGNVVRFNRGYKSLGIQKGDYYSVAASRQDKNQLVLQPIDMGSGQQGQEKAEITWNPYETGGRRDGAISVFEKRDIALAAGDQIKMTRTNKESAITNGDTFTVKAVHADRVEMIGSDGQVRGFDKNDPDLRHVDYGYAQTAHGAQGMTFDKVLAVVDSKIKALANQQLFYVTISRARLETNLVVDDTKALISQLERVTGEKLSSLEVAGLQEAVYTATQPHLEQGGDPAQPQHEPKDERSPQEPERAEERQPERESPNAPSLPGIEERQEREREIEKDHGLEL